MNTGKRSEQRLPAVLPVVIVGADEDGNAIRVHAWTVDVSVGGARLVGLPPIRRGELVSVIHAEKRARFKVVWAGAKNSLLVGQMSVRALEPENWIWSVPQPKNAFRDHYREGRTHTTAEEVASAEYKKSLALRIAELAGELRSVEALAQAEKLDPRLLHPYRQATAYLAEALKAVQGWLELEVARRDPFEVLTPLTLSRLRLLSALANELTVELEGADLPLSEKEVVVFCRTMKDCTRRILTLESNARSAGFGAK